MSELNALKADPPFTSFHKDKVVLKPDHWFFPKALSDFHINQSINLSFFPVSHILIKENLFSIN